MAPHTARIQKTSQLEDLRRTHDPDYLVIFEGNPGEHLEDLVTSLLSSGESRLINVSKLRPHTPKAREVLPVAKSIYISDYIGGDVLSSQLLETWLTEINSHSRLTIPGDGLEEYSILTLEDLARSLARAILHPSKRAGEELYLGNPSPISLLNLAYLIRTNINSKITIIFDPDAHSNLWKYDSSLLAKTLDSLSYQIQGDPEFQLGTYLSQKQAPANQALPSTQPEAPKPPPRVEQPPVPSLRKLTPLKHPTPVFVPLKSPRLKPSLKSNPLAKYSGPLRLRTILGRGLIIAIALYLGTLAFSITITGLSLKQMSLVMSRGELPTSSVLATASSTYFRANWHAFISIPGIAKSKSVSDITILLDSYSQALSTFKTAQALSTTTAELTSYIFGTNTSDVAQLVSLSRLQAEELYEKLSLLDGSLPSETPRDSSG